MGEQLAHVVDVQNRLLRGAVLEGGLLAIAADAHQELLHKLGVGVVAGT